MVENSKFGNRIPVHHEVYKGKNMKHEIKYHTKHLIVNIKRTVKSLYEQRRGRQCGEENMAQHIHIHEHKHQDKTTRKRILS